MDAGECQVFTSRLDVVVHHCHLRHVLSAEEQPAARALMMHALVAALVRAYAGRVCPADPVFPFLVGENVAKLRRASLPVAGIRIVRAALAVGSAKRMAAVDAFGHGGPAASITKQPPAEVARSLDAQSGIPYR